MFMHLSTNLYTVYQKSLEHSLHLSEQKLSKELQSRALRYFEISGFGLNLSAFSLFDYWDDTIPLLV